MKLKYVLAAVLLLPSLAVAGGRNDLNSCYDQAKLVDMKQPPSGRQLIVIVDQTIPMPTDIQHAAWGQIVRYVQPGDQAKLYSFSAFVPGEYMRLLSDVTLDAPVPESTRNDINMNKLRGFDNCLKGQTDRFAKHFGGSLVKAMREASEELPRSEIMHALREVGKDISRQPARERTVFLISDMLEHSDYTSFYASNRIRDLNVPAELKKAKEKDLFADLAGAKVFVAGAGLVTKGIKQDYRSGKTMDLLGGFWSSYFQQSNASLEAFGTPALNIDLQ